MCCSVSLFTCLPIIILIVLREYWWQVEIRRMMCLNIQHHAHHLQWVHSEQSVPQFLRLCQWWQTESVHLLIQWKTTKYQTKQNNPPSVWGSPQLQLRVQAAFLQICRDLNMLGFIISISYRVNIWDHWEEKKHVHMETCPPRQAQWWMQLIFRSSVCR